MTQEDIKLCDIYSTFMVVLIHGAEMCLQELERVYANDYKRGENFKQLVKKYGIARATEMLGEVSHKIIRGQERGQIGKILKAGRDFHYQMERFTEMAAKAHTDAVSDIDSFDALMHDARLVVRMWARVCDLPSDEALLKAESTLMVLANGKRRIPQAVFDAFRRDLTA